MTKSIQDLEKTRNKLAMASRKGNSPVEKLEGCLKVIAETLAAKRGFVMLYDSHLNKLEVYGTINFDPETIFTSGDISLTILNKVYDNENPILSSSAVDDPRFKEKMSVVLSGLQSFVTVPISGDEGLLGVLYLDNPNQEAAFDEKDLKFLKECCKILTSIIIGLFPHIRPKPIAL